MMSVVRTVNTSVRALRRNVTRTILTCLGIIIGIAAVIAMMEIGNGVSALNAKTIAALGANSIMIQPGAQQTSGINYGAGSTQTLTPDDATAILQNCTAVSSAAPTVDSHAQMIYGNKNWTPQQITGTTPAYLDVRDWALEDGANFTDQDVISRAPVALIGQTIKREVFSNVDPVGKEFRLGPVTMKVVGVLTSKGANMWGRDQDDIVVCPWTTIKFRISGKTTSVSSASVASSSSSSTSINTINNIYPGTSVSLYPSMAAQVANDSPMQVRFINVNQIMAAASSQGQIPTAISQIENVLRQRHKLRPDEDDDFTTRDMTELSNAMGTQTALMSNLLLIVAAISLLVGGVGIMNIMLVSVTERTREIGLRMAVGARSRDILRQFLIEATVLCLLGGIVGIALGRISSLMVREFKHWPTQISYPAIIGSVIVSTLVGVVFGFYPAWKASRLDPIEALRYE